MRNLSSASVGFVNFFGYKIPMRFKSRLIRGTLIQRYKRFLADVRLANDEIVTAHCTNTGSMMGCKEPGSAVYISRSDNLNRKLAYTWEMIEITGRWVGINTMHPNKLVAEAVESGMIEELSGYSSHSPRSQGQRPYETRLVPGRKRRQLLRRSEERHPRRRWQRGFSRRRKRAGHQTLERTHSSQAARPSRRPRLRHPTR